MTTDSNEDHSGAMVKAPTLALQKNSSSLVRRAIQDLARFSSPGRLKGLNSARHSRTFEKYEASITSLDLSPDGRWALSGHFDETLCLWDISTGKCVRIFEGDTDSEECTVNSVAISPDGRFVLSGSCDNTIRLWDIFTGKCIRIFEGHTARTDIYNSIHQRNGYFSPCLGGWGMA